VDLRWEVRSALAKERNRTTRHPEERSDQGSASTKAPPPLGQIPPRPLRVRVRDDTNEELGVGSDVVDVFGSLEELEWARAREAPAVHGSAAKAGHGPELRADR